MKQSLIALLLAVAGISSAYAYDYTQEANLKNMQEYQQKINMAVKAEQLSTACMYAKLNTQASMSTNPETYQMSIKFEQQVCGMYAKFGDNYSAKMAAANAK